MSRHLVYLGQVSKHLIDLDETALAAARAALGTATMKDTVNEALRHVASHAGTAVADALGVLAAIEFDDRAAAWR